MTDKYYAVIRSFGIYMSLIAFLFFTACMPENPKPLRVFILAGQSNMVGVGEVKKGDQGNLTYLVDNDEKGEYQHLVDAEGEWKVRDDVFIYFERQGKDVNTGGLMVGYGANDSTIGPELQFGNVVGDNYDGDVLIIKTAWGGKSLAVDFCPPGAAGESGYKYMPTAAGDTGYYYVQMLATVNEVLDRVGDYVPSYEGQGYEIAGFGWHQGWNDRINQLAIDAYQENMIQFIKDVRRDIGVPKLPFVIATTGMAGWNETHPRALSLMEAQLAVGDYPDFSGNVKVVETRDFWREAEDSPANQSYHWNRNAESYFLIGKSMGESMIEILEDASQRDEKVASGIRFENYANGLAATPPMGWNSWNTFQKDINEKLIMDIADVMVSSGMRDAGYEHLVLDDAWMAAERNENGELVADPEKFPGGMKAVGDYIHSKGLKYGIYECRGYLTCQQLPGSFEHEQIDMSTFASWGVDYIKLDACFAENNGRLTSEDLAIYHEAINNTDRPMLLSISDFGSGGWAYAGKKYGQLWRTSGDIFPWIGSVYNCGNTSGGSRSSHPAFNGLWQFAGPGHWNDPDMLQVGNLENAQQDKAHFSIWCILAAPLMAGNDLRNMSDTEHNILTAPEVIAVNQDPRGHQGYKVYDEDSIEVYNKPLADGTTAILLINKGEENTDITVNWDQVGLKGKQKVRDLWAMEDMGYYKNSFTAKDLAQHELMLIKVGEEGSDPIPGPDPLPLESYAVTKAGTTYLSDLYYIMKKDRSADPVMDKSYNGKKITINGKTYEKGIGCKSGSLFMYKLNGKADRLKAVVGLDEASPDSTSGRFRILVEEFFGGKAIFDSGKMNKGDKEKIIDIDVSNLDLISLEFTGKNPLGNWADVKVVAYDK
ncbi:MAG: NPCBM/NEW2 domain-containing protein [Candidatus Curtissbacteria bacterium]